MQLLRKTQSQFTQLDQQQIFFRLFSELELKQFYSNSSSSSGKLFFRLQVQVRQNNQAFSSLQPWSQHINTTLELITAVKEDQTEQLVLNH